MGGGEDSGGHGMLFDVARVKDLFQNDRTNGRNMFLATSLILYGWFFINAGYTMFNTFLPALLVALGIDNDNVYLDTLFYTLASIPGALVGGWLVESSFGRKWSLVLSCSCCAIGLYFFTVLQSETAIVLAEAGINFFAQIFYAALFAYTPEMYPTKIRTTGVGVATSVSRIAGSLAPVLAGFLLSLGADENTNDDTTSCANCVLYGAMFCIGSSALVLAFLPFDTSKAALS
jgi:cyanate permease